MSTLQPAHPMWQNPSPDILDRLRHTLDKAISEAEIRAPVPFFFRADDIGAPSAQFSSMTLPFLRHRAPLALAVVPAWLTRNRWNSLLSLHQQDSALWCWHQHGWRHQNHEVTGKKQEFGPSRSHGQIVKDFVSGKERLSDLMGKVFEPIFTPPWNRMGQTALDAARGLGYLAVSRSMGASPPSINGLPDLFVDVDLHTRKEPDGDAAWEALLAEFRTAILRGRCGIMIHHQRMNPKAVEFLDALLVVLKSENRIQLLPIKDLLPNDAPTP
jgi:hypothetical protein